MQVQSSTVEKEVACEKGGKGKHILLKVTYSKREWTEKGTEKQTHREMKTDGDNLAGEERVLS